ncbi:MAG: Zn-dependent hydrolase [Sulfitobacter litoralis]|jgi:allantoate deiminase|uniref:Zn-dependent hydrolase n=1 Tax=Sulfitobacter TaxID=60136 RepID=UPI001B4349B9|nr:MULTISPECIES: Zn-dependent hydrolase [Sulfitobacter]MBQ0766038.1 Zn-dependent hydrolase [Sulfitobacter litoralis]MCF7727306.1 hydantoinase/carbamoylase family amidase [Sulfitobacter sp. M22]MCF7778670.1 hydantoinase/carbamoylase family amidase [Sulfitobacter sp. M220]|tara:strand:- start:1922 stop:3157 length:1236 start_codon:yes stop_codon:yes gene_type:complete
MTNFANPDRIQSMIDGLDAFNATPGEGTTRATFSPEFRQASDYLRAQMEKAGLVVREDAVGNLFGRLVGRDPALAPVLVGSHFDSVPHGGKFDGPAGVIAGIETAFLFQEQGITPTRSIDVIAMIEEEGSRFGSGLMASRLLTGKLPTQQLSQIKDAAGISFTEAMRSYGLDPEQLRDVLLPKEAAHAFLELHIEQGPVLEAQGEDVAIVDSIVCLTQLRVRIYGAAGHAGTTPMNARRDALVGAVAVLSELPGLAKDIGQNAVLTVGKVDVKPGGANVIPDEVEFTVDIRAPEEDVVRQLVAQTRAAVARAEDAGFRTDVVEDLFAQPTMLSSEIHTRLTKHADQLQLKSRSMVSGAGHDAMIMADYVPTGLIFVPSRNGVSHSPDEWTDYDQLARGVDVIFATIREMTE